MVQDGPGNGRERSRKHILVQKSRNSKFEPSLFIALERHLSRWENGVHITAG